MEAERRRQRLQRVLGDISNGALFERALIALEAETNSKASAA
jgi:hypothetical protein